MFEHKEIKNMIEHRKIKRNMIEHKEIKKYDRAPKDKKNMFEYNKNFQKHS